MSSVLDAFPETIVLTPWAAVGRIKVRFYPGERSLATRCAENLFGRVLRRSEYAGLAGALAGARVEVGMLDGGLYLETRDSPGGCYRAVQRVRLAARLPVLVIEALHIFPRRMRRRGLGLRMFTRQVAQARRLGVERIETTAGRRRDENGYYTWPRYGFDGPLPDGIRRLLPPCLDGARSVLDLIGCDLGRRWWRLHGTTLDVAFDLAERSRSQWALARYVCEKSSSGGLRPV